MNKVLLGTILILVIGLGISNANALPTVNLGKIVTGAVLTNTPKIISIDLSNQCISLVKNNQTSECPSYKPIIRYDNSNQYISGRFIETGGFLHRTISHTLNHYKMYPPGQWVIMVDPDYSTILHSQEITIVPSLNYAIPDQLIGNNHTITTYQNRYVNPTCTNAQIVYSDFLLNDTIYYLESGCKITQFKEKVTTKLPNKAPSDFNNPSLKYKVTIDKIKTARMGDCIHNICTQTTSSKKW